MQFPVANPRPPDVEPLLRDSPLAYAYLTWPEARYAYVNPAQARLSGTTVEEMLGCTPQEVYGPELPERMRPAVCALLDGSDSFAELEVEAAVTGRPDNRVFLVQCHAVRAEDGTATGIWFVTRDITEKRRLAEANRRQQAYLQTVMDAVPAGILLSDADGKLTYANQEAERIWGHALIEAPPEQYARYELYHLNGMRALPQETALYRALDSGQRTATTRLVRRADGSSVEAYSIAAPLRDDAGATVGAVLALTDLTSLRRLERQQARMMEIAQAVNAGIELRDILLMVRDAVVETGAFDRAGLWLYSAERDGMAGTWGTDRDGRPLDEAHKFWPIVHPEDHPIRRILRGELRYYLTPAYDTELRPAVQVEMQGVQAHATLALAAHGRVIGMLFVDNLLTLRPITEDDLRSLLPFCEQAAVAIESARMRETERAQARELAEAVRVTNHRVNNNLQIVVALLETQLMECGDTVGRAEVERLWRQVRAMAAVHQFLGDTRHELDASVDEVLQTLLPVLESGAGLRCAVSCDATIVTVKQATALALILNELLANAERAGAREVEICFHADDGRHALTVRDDGPGFPAGFQPRRDARRGLEYVDRVARWDLLGDIRFGNRGDVGGGAEVVVTF